MRIVKKIIILICSVALSAVLFLVVANQLVVNAAKHKNFSDVEKIDFAEVGVLLGTSKYRKKGVINLYFQYRIEAAVKLYQAGKIKYILVSGDNSSQFYNEPLMFKKELMEYGIPEEVIFLDYAGFRTLDSVIRAHKVFGLSKFIVISQQFHNERAIYIGKNSNIDIQGFNAKDVSKMYGVKTKVREYFARGKAVLDIIVNKQPKFLGDTIQIK